MCPLTRHHFHGSPPPHFNNRIIILFECIKHSSPTSSDRDEGPCQPRPPPSLCRLLRLALHGYGISFGAHCKTCGKCKLAKDELVMMGGGGDGGGEWWRGGVVASNGGWGGFDNGGVGMGFRKKISPPFSLCENPLVNHLLPLPENHLETLVPPANTSTILLLPSLCPALWPSTWQLLLCG